METTRFPVNGSCHCGKNKYIAWLTFPKDPGADFADRAPNTISRTYKCNCTICHKAGLFHVRLVDAPNDFILLDPPSDDEPLSNLGGYSCNAARVQWYFCKTCGVRMFVVWAKGEVSSVDVAEYLGEKPSGSLQKVWKVQAEGYEEGKTGYFSINGPTIDTDGSQLDLRKLYDRGWMRYLDEWKDIGGWERKPHEGGVY